MADQRADICYSVVIPVFNSDRSLQELYARTCRVFEQQLNTPCEIIFIDDCSENPATWPRLQSLQQKDSRVVIVQLMRNFGQHAATLCGFAYARGAYIITMDDDLQHSPEDIPLLTALRDDYDIVIGQFKQNRHSLFKQAVSKIKGWFDRKIMGKPKGLYLSSFRLLNRATVRAMLRISTCYPIMASLMFTVTQRVTGVFVKHSKRRFGRSNYTVRRMVRLFSNLLINNSTFLLTLIGRFGILIAFGSFVGALFSLAKRFFWGIGVTGWTSLIVTTTFLGGTILFTLSIIGEYLIRIIYEVEKHPRYIVRAVKGRPAQEEPL